MGWFFCVGSFVFKSGFFCSPFLSVALTASPTAPARPLVAPSEEHFHGGGLAAPLFREGRRTEDAQQSSKKNSMPPLASAPRGMKTGKAGVQPLAEAIAA